MNEPTSEQIARLPKWVQEHIASLNRRCDNAERDLREWTDHQTEQPFRVLEFVGPGTRPVYRYIEGRSIRAQWGGIELDVALGGDGHISVYFSPLRGSTSRQIVGVFPRASNLVEFRRVANGQSETVRSHP